MRRMGQMGLKRTIELREFRNAIGRWSDEGTA
jgi:hypothetical protein